MEYDLIIKNSKIIDGTGNPWYQANIGISDGKITKIGRLDKSKTDREINANGLVLTPGFIDPHSHSDFAIPFDSRLESTIRQGITTAVIGNCGDSLAPINREKLDLFEKMANIFSPPGETLSITWQSFDEYLLILEKGECSTNIVPLVGFGTVRIAGGPGFEDRPPTNEELERMKMYIHEAMQSGAFGMSTGLIYTPQIYANTEEIIELAKVVAEYGGLYFSHIRGEGASVINAIEELIRIVKKSGCSGGQIAHHKVSGRLNWGKSKNTLQLLVEANQNGLNITCDQYPYNRGMTSLITVLPPWVHIGGIEKILERLEDSKSLERIRKDITQGIKGWENWMKDLGTDKIYISSVKTERWKDVEGKSISEITKLKGKKDDFRTIFDLIREEKGEVSILVEGMHEEDIRRIMTNKFTMIGTDGWGVAPTGVLGHGKPHPRFYGTYPRVLGKYVRQEGLLRIEDAIRKMTSFPAQKLGLHDRGLIRENMWADIVIIDSNEVIDRATYDNPHQFPVGIKYVIINGEIVVKNEIQTEKLPGRILRHQ
ncbi:MAG: D-aminoacylase [Candidatus Heimdallarchaeota archaeon]|nr:MAG: D-aminoacylase [Candidatus Heimdallarchaeota archaeon]